MECAGLPDDGYIPFRGRIFEQALKERTPVSGSIELTAACNLECVHCYISGTGRNIGELTLDELRDLIDQLAEEGCLWLLLTGGEPLVREDFGEIYSHVKRRGILPLLFTNGTLVTGELADLLASEPPFNVEITLYGATEKTFESVTGVPGSFARCMEGIDHLLRRGIRLSLKTMAMTLNSHEIREMKALARRLGVPFRFDTMLNSRLDGDGTPADYRLSSEEVLDLDREDGKRLGDLSELAGKFRGDAAGSDRIYMCGAGTSTFNIDATGKLTVCMMARDEYFDLRNGSFSEGWREFIPRILERKWSREVPCAACRLRSMCGQCPGWGWLEHGDPEEKVEFLCSVAGARAEMLGLDVRRPYDIPFETGEHK
jgi:radical SAM protein with 4Fe4S-binding SPASM domain